MAIRPATPADQPRIDQVRNGTLENRLLDPGRVTRAEYDWYVREAIVLVAEYVGGIQGFVAANHQTGYVWALFVIDAAQGLGHGRALLDAALVGLRRAGHRQSFLSTGAGTRAEGFYRAQGWHCMGPNLSGEVVYRFWL